MRSNPFLYTFAPLLFVSLLFTCGALQAEVEARGESKEKKAWKVVRVLQGKASWYGTKCNGGNHTASGEKLVDSSSTAAHKSLPMDTRVRVTNIKNGKSEVVRINNRGPYVKGRIIDVTVGVAKRIGFHKRGVAKVKVEVLKKAQTPSSP